MGSIVQLFVVPYDKETERERPRAAAATQKNINDNDGEPRTGLWFWRETKRMDNHRLVLCEWLCRFGTHKKRVTASSQFIPAAT